MMISQDIRFTKEQQHQLQRQLADKITNYASIEEIRALLICGAQPDGEVTRGLTPLHYACFINNVSAAKLLLTKGAKVDAVDEVGCSALHLCAEHGYYRMIKLLLQYTPVVQQYETPVMERNGKYPSRENIDEPLRLAIKQETPENKFKPWKKYHSWEEKCVSPLNPRHKYNRIDKPSLGLISRVGRVQKKEKYN
ncbi:hypothetical protein Y032_0017g3396 [Ancylostoma ceylanicum]|nr:hypothetical protein Y032_0017g3396 [Ancylostoma ceylanicum]